MSPSTISKKTGKPRRYLEANFEPHPNDVLIGRGRMVETHNRKFRAMISSHLAAYYNAQTKATKSTIILRIFQQVKRGGGTGFVKREASSKRWYVIEDAAARISIAQAFRDALSSEYKSSKQYKQQKRKEERGELDVLTEEIPFSLASVSQNLMIPSPPRLLPVVSSDGRDLTRSSLQAILEQATNVVADVDAESLLRSAPEEVPMPALSVSTMPTISMIPQETSFLAGLEQAIGCDYMDLNSNPFEPTPLVDISLPMSLPSSDLLLGDGDADLMDSLRLQQEQHQQKEEEDIFQVFDTIPALDMRHALGA